MITMFEFHCYRQHMLMQLHALPIVVHSVEVLPLIELYMILSSQENCNGTHFFHFCVDNHVSQTYTMDVVYAQLMIRNLFRIKHQRFCSVDFNASVKFQNHFCVLFIRLFLTQCFLGEQFTLQNVIIFSILFVCVVCQP